MTDAVQLITVHGGVERVFHLAGGAAEFDAAPARGDLVHLKTLRLEPPDDGVEILLGGTEPLAEPQRGQPGMIPGRGWILLLGQQLLQVGFLLRAALELEQKPVHPQIGSHAA